MIEQAIEFATIRHAGQTRKGSGLPYIVHPLEVMLILIRHGVTSEVILVAAILHDVVEDTETTIEEIRAFFGDRVADIVAQLTKDEGLKGEAKHAAMRTQAETFSAAAALVKAADRLSNIRDLYKMSWKTESKKGYLDFADFLVTLLVRFKGEMPQAELLAASLYAESTRQKQRIGT